MNRSVALLFVFLACGLASAQTADCGALTHQALELSGFNQSIDHISDVISSEQFMQQYAAGTPRKSLLRSSRRL